MKKIVITSFVLLALLAGTTYAYQEQQSTNHDYQIAMSEADFIMFEDLEEIETYAQYIVLAKFTGNRDIKKWKNEDDVKIASKSEIEIKKVFRGDVEEEQQIAVYEPAYFDDDVFDTIEGYNLMNEDGEYVLFLRDSDGEGYAIIGMYQGKYDISTSKKAKQAKTGDTYRSVADSEYFGPHVDQFHALKEEVVKKYN